jgi:aminopeptidase N
VGREAMDRALREYVRRWAFKHPTPGDFFRTVENVTGADLSWFWRGFFYSTAVLDVRIDSVVTQVPADRDSAAGSVASIFLQRTTSIVFPVEMRLRLANGTTSDVRLPVDVWASGMDIEAQFPVTARVVGVRLWPDRVAIPARSDHDTWGNAPPADPPGAATTGGLASPITPR